MSAATQARYVARHPERAKEISHESYLKHREARCERVRSKRARRRLFLKSLKVDGCVACGSLDELDFHHVDPALKDFPLGGTKAMGVSEARFLAEIEKCEVLCRDCHQAEHSAFA